VDLDDVEKYTKIPGGSILLKDFILDKKILDLEETEVEVVYDIKMVMSKNKLYVTDIDPSKNARLRRLGFDKFTNFIHRRSDKNKDDLSPGPMYKPYPTILEALMEM
jgi:hypothetical protein